MSETTSIERMVQNDPLIREGTELMVMMLNDLIHKHPDLLFQKDDSKSKLANIISQGKRAWSKPTQEVLKEFWQSEGIVGIMSQPSLWPTPRNILNNGIRDALKSFSFNLAAQSVAFTCSYNSSHGFNSLLWVNAFSVLWVCLILWRRKADWRSVRQWDRMWESSAVARLICPDHPAFNPPRRARKVIAFFHSPETCYDVLEMLDENFEKHSAEFGFRYARNWYAWNALKSLSPMLDAGIERAVKWSFIGGMIEWARHFLMNRN